MYLKIGYNSIWNGKFTNAYHCFAFFQTSSLKINTRRMGRKYDLYLLGWQEKRSDLILSLVWVLLFHLFLLILWRLYSFFVLWIWKISFSQTWLSEKNVSDIKTSNSLKPKNQYNLQRINKKKDGKGEPIPKKE